MYRFFSFFFSSLVFFFSFLHLLFQISHTCIWKSERSFIKKKKVREAKCFEVWTFNGFAQFHIAVFDVGGTKGFEVHEDKIRQWQIKDAGEVSIMVDKRRRRSVDNGRSKIFSSRAGSSSQIHFFHLSFIILYCACCDFLKIK